MKKILYWVVYFTSLFFWYSWALWNSEICQKSGWVAVCFYQQSVLVLLVMNVLFFLLLTSILLSVFLSFIQATLIQSLLGFHIDFKKLQPSFFDQLLLISLPFCPCEIIVNPQIEMESTYNWSWSCGPLQYVIFEFCWENTYCWLLFDKGEVKVCIIDICVI